MIPSVSLRRLYMNNYIALSDKDQEFIVTSIKLGLEALKACGGQEAVQKYIPKIESLLTISDGLEFLHTLKEILEAMEEELNEYVR